MMKLDDTALFIKNNLQNILDGYFDDKFSGEQLRTMLEMSFLYNHINFELDSIVFKYNHQKLKINNISIMIESLIAPEEILSMIKIDNVFKSSYISFLRDKKIVDILAFLL